jgi:hypothetical protein
MSKTNKNEPFGSSLEVSTVALGGCGQVRQPVWRYF